MALIKGLKLRHGILKTKQNQWEFMFGKLLTAFSKFNLFPLTWDHHLNRIDTISSISLNFLYFGLFCCITDTMFLFLNLLRLNHTKLIPFSEKLEAHFHCYSRFASTYWLIFFIWKRSGVVTFFRQILQTRKSILNGQKMNSAQKSLVDKAERALYLWILVGYGLRWFYPSMISISFLVKPESNKYFYSTIVPELLFNNIGIRILIFFIELYITAIDFANVSFVAVIFLCHNYILECWMSVVSCSCFFYTVIQLEPLLRIINHTNNLDFKNSTHICLMFLLILKVFAIYIGLKGQHIDPFYRGIIIVFVFVAFSFEQVWFTKSQALTDSSKEYCRKLKLSSSKYLRCVGRSIHWNRFCVKAGNLFKLNNNTMFTYFLNVFNYSITVLTYNRS